jgi:hypothetical protein
MSEMMSEITEPGDGNAAGLMLVDAGRCWAMLVDATRTEADGRVSLGAQVHARARRLHRAKGEASRYVV